MSSQEVEAASPVDAATSSNGRPFVPFGNLVQALLGGGTPSTKESSFWDGKIPWTTSAPISQDATELQTPQRFITEAGLEHSSSHLVPRDSLIVGTRVGVGKAVVNTIDIAISQDLTGVVVRHDLVDVHYLALFFKTHSTQNFFEARKRGTTIKGISKSDLTALPIRLPPLPEQRHIVKALRAVQHAAEARRREAELERERKAALMQHLFGLGISDDEYGVQDSKYGTLPARWRVLPLADCAHVQTGVAKGRKLNGAKTLDVPYLRVANVQDGYLDLSEIKTITIAEREMDRYRLKDGDVVVTEGGDFDKLGRGFIWRGQVENCVHQNHVFAVRVRPDLLLPHYLAYLVQSAYGRAYFLSVAHKTTNLACINTAKLKAMPVPVPEVGEQREIVAALDACDSKLVAVEQEARALDELFRALLEELMTGRLSATPLIEHGETP